MTRSIHKEFDGCFWGAIIIIAISALVAVALIWWSVYKFFGS